MIDWLLTSFLVEPAVTAVTLLTIVPTCIRKRLIKQHLSIYLLNPIIDAPLQAI